jgi:3-oxoacyl-[acyl-carrier protein] reductase
MSNSILTTDLSPHLALITGATGGIGKAACLALAALAALGCSIAVHYNSAADTAASLVDNLKAKGVRAEAFPSRSLELRGRKETARRCRCDDGNPSVLFNNTGLTLGKSGVKSIQDISVEDFERTWCANCGTAYLLTQLCMPFMEEKGFGRVIFCSSVAGFTGGVVGPHYASSKSAMHGLIHWLAGNVAKKGITVNGVALALIEDTKMLPGGQGEGADGLRARIPVGRLGRPEEIAETVCWMVKTGYVSISMQEMPAQ